MGIISGFLKTKKYRKTENGYQLQSEWTSAQTVEMNDGSTLEDKIESIQTGKANSSHNQSASTITAGTFDGKVLANTSAVAILGDKQIRNIYVGETELTSGTSALPTGDIYIQYE